MLQIISYEFAGVVDKAGSPYILHCIRVGMAGKTEDEKIVGFGHDLIEDRGWTKERLRGEGFSELQVSGIDSVSRRDGESYMDFIRRAHEHPVGRAVKRNDLDDNRDLSRLTVVTADDLSRQRRYDRALALMDQLDAAEAGESLSNPRRNSPRP
jgi:(p)ppGpp synthase/HD superfamily hydrolase